MKSAIKLNWHDCINVYCIYDYLCMHTVLYIHVLYTYIRCYDEWMNEWKWNLSNSMSNVEVNVWFRGDNEYIMRIDLLTAFGIKKKIKQSSGMIKRMTTRSIYIVYCSKWKWYKSIKYIYIKESYSLPTDVDLDLSCNSRSDTEYSNKLCLLNNNNNNHNDDPFSWMFTKY